MVCEEVLLALPVLPVPNYEPPSDKLLPNFVLIPTLWLRKPDIASWGFLLGLRGCYLLLTSVTKQLEEMHALRIKEVLFSFPASSSTITLMGKCHI